MNNSIGVTLRFSGNMADNGYIELYDVGLALIGFQRSLALTTHLVLNGEVIVRAPSLRGAKILGHPPSDGSWKILSTIALAGTAVYSLGTAPKDTPIGHVVYSAYDYVISKSLGTHVDYEKSLAQLYEMSEDNQASKVVMPPKRKLDELSENCSNAVRDMHRPIFGKHSANQANIIFDVNGIEFDLTQELNSDSYERIMSAKSFE